MIGYRALSLACLVLGTVVRDSAGRWGDATCVSTTRLLSLPRECRPAVPTRRGRGSGTSSCRRSQRGSRRAAS